MNFNVQLESSYFKAKQSKKFSEQVYKEIEAEDLEVNLTKQGIKIYATNIYDDEFKLEQLIQQNLPENETANLIRVGMKDNGTEIDVTMSFVNHLGFIHKSYDQLVENLSESIYPRYKKANDSTYNSKEGMWLEKDAPYLVLEESGEHLIVQHENGMKIKWSKGDFYAG